MEAVITLTIFSFITCLFLFKFFIKYARAKHLVDIPNQRKLQKVPTPTSGGVPLFITVIIAGIIGYTINIITWEALFLLVLGFGMMILGFFDDRKELSARKRILIELAISFVAIILGFKIENLHGFLGIYELHIVVQYALSLFIILSFINAFNLIDGIDGLLGSISLINFIVLAVLFYTKGNESFFLLSTIISISLLSFLIFNFYPAKIFMGDSGSLVIGFFTACFSFELINGESVSHLSDLMYLIALVTIPLFDTFRVMMIRLINKASPFHADNNHAHHYLIKFGYNHKKATIYIALSHLLFLLTTIIVYPHWGKDTWVFLVLFVTGFSELITYKKVISHKAQKIKQAFLRRKLVQESNLIQKNI